MAEKARRHQELPGQWRCSPLHELTVKIVLLYRRPRDCHMREASGADEMLWEATDKGCQETKPRHLVMVQCFATEPSWLFFLQRGDGSAKARTWVLKVRGRKEEESPKGKTTANDGEQTTTIAQKYS